MRRKLRVRDHRRYAIKPRDLIAELMGDPPLPGESALEKRRGRNE
jgi:hypothetical protein